MSQLPSPNQSPFSKVADLRFGEFVGQVTKNLNLAGVKNLTYNTLGMLNLTSYRLTKT